MRLVALAAAVMSALWLVKELLAGSYVTALAAWILASVCVTAAWSSRTVAPDDLSATPLRASGPAPGRARVRLPGALRTRLKLVIVFAGPPSIAAGVTILVLLVGRSADPDIPVPLLLSLVALASAYGGLLEGTITALIVTFGFAAVAEPAAGIISIGMASAVIVIAVGVLSRNARRAYNSLNTANERLRRIAFRDPVTGLLDRRGFVTVLHTEIARHSRRGSELTILVLEIDQAELKGRQLRRSLTETVLQSLAEAIEQQVRSSDTAARIDSHEFAVCLPDTPSVAAALVRDRVVSGFHKNLTAYIPGAAPLAVRTGIVAYPTEARTAAELLTAAERRIEETD